MEKIKYMVIIFLFIFACQRKKEKLVTVKDVIVTTRQYNKYIDSLSDYHNYDEKFVKLAVIDSIAKEVIIDNPEDKLYVSGILVYDKKYGWWLLKKDSLRLETEYLLKNGKINQQKTFVNKKLDTLHSFYTETNYSLKEDSVKYNINYFYPAFYSDSSIINFFYNINFDKKDRYAKGKVFNNRAEIQITIPKMSSKEIIIDGVIYETSFLSTQKTALRKELEIIDSIVWR